MDCVTGSIVHPCNITHYAIISWNYGYPWAKFQLFLLQPQHQNHLGQSVCMSVCLSLLAYLSYAIFFVDAPMIFFYNLVYSTFWTPQVQNIFFTLIKKIFLQTLVEMIFGAPLRTKFLHVRSWVSKMCKKSALCSFLKEFLENNKK